LCCPANPRNLFGACPLNSQPEAIRLLDMCMNCLS
jgi:hypothetical protein